MDEDLPINLTLTLNFKCTEESLGPKRDNLYIVVPISVIYLIIFITGTIGNISTGIVIARNKAMHTATNYYLFSLAISDLLLLISGLPQEIFIIWSRYPYIFGSAFCFLRGLCAETSANATVLTITAFTVERYLAICHPFLSHTLSKLTRAVKFIFGIWLLAICLAIPQAMQFQILEGENDCELCQFIEPFVEHSFIVSTVVFFVAPMSLITVLYILIGLRLRTSSMMKKRSTNARIQTKSSKKVVKMLVAVVIAFFICWAPFHAQRLFSFYSLSSVNKDVSTQTLYLKIYEIVTYISGILYYLSATINPILYNIMSIKFRNAFKETFAKCCSCGKLQHPQPQQQSSYSVLSRSAQRCPDSSDSSKEFSTLHTHTCHDQKSFTESLNSGQASHTFSRKSNHVYLMQQDDCIEEEFCHNCKRRSSFIKLHLKSAEKTPTHFHRFTRYFQSIVKHSSALDQNNRDFLRSTKKPNVILEIVQTTSEDHRNPLTLSNFHIRDACTEGDGDNMMIEDELTIYMKEIKRRERCS